jgi:hypothetical protein
MHARLVNTAAEVIARAMENGRQTPAGWAVALDSACLLQSPETAAELVALRARLTDVHRMPQDNLTPAEVRLGQYRRPPRTFETGSERDLYDIAAGLQAALGEVREQRDAARLRAIEFQDRVTELEVAAIEGRAALAALCHDLEDPGSNAFGALFLLQQATPGTPMEPGEPTPTVYRASHDSIVMGLYTTADAARAHCEASARESIAGDISLDWIEDEEDGVGELVYTRVDGVECTTGYVVTALEVAASYDEGADE